MPLQSLNVLPVLPKHGKPGTVLENMCPEKRTGCQGIKERVLFLTFFSRKDAWACVGKKASKGQ